MEGALDRFTPTKALGVGLLFTAGNPKILLLTLTAAVTISANGLTSGAQIDPTPQLGWRRTAE